MEALTIPFDVSDLPDSVRIATELSRAMDGVSTASERASASVRKLGSDSFNAARSAATYTSVTTKLASVSGQLGAPPRIQPALGPMSGSGGSLTQIGESTKPSSSPLSNIVQAAGKGISGGNGAVEIASQALGALGPYGEAAGAIVTQGAKMVAHALESGSKRISLAFDSGSWKSANRVTGLGAGLGFDAATTSSTFYNSMGEEGAKSFYAKQAGINTTSDVMGGGNQDAAGSLSDFLRFYGDPTKSDEKSARMAARSFGLTDEVGLARAASAGVREKMFGYKAEAMDSETQTAVADSKILSGIATDRLSATGDKLVATVLPALAEALEGLEPAFEAFTVLIKQMTPALEFLGKMAAKDFTNLAHSLKLVGDFLMGNYGALGKDLHDLLNSNHSKQKTVQAKAAETQLQAAKELKEAAAELKDGVSGAGANRARQALPQGMNYNCSSARAHVQLGGIVF